MPSATPNCFHLPHDSASRSRAKDTHCCAMATSEASSSRQVLQEDEEQRDAAWLASLDAVYRLIEDEEVARRYPQLSRRIADAVKLTEEAVQEIGLPRISLSFNGGKDCKTNLRGSARQEFLTNCEFSYTGTVIAHILAAVLRRTARGTTQLSISISVPATRAVYITCDSPFIEVERFIAASLPRYNLRIRSVDGNMKQGLEQYLDGGGRHFESPSRKASRSRPCEETEADGDSGKGITAIFIGTRSTDPNGGSVGKRAWTDAGWPQVERIHPILDWTYQDVWSFLRCPLLAYQPPTRLTKEQREEEGCAQTPGIPYCLLYDLG